MRTTITLSPDAEALIKATMKQRGITFKQAVNEAILQGARPQGSADRRFSTPTLDLGRASVPVERALTLAAELENEELLRKRALGK